MSGTVTMKNSMVDGTKEVTAIEIIDEPEKSLDKFSVKSEITPITSSSSKKVNGVTSSSPIVKSNHIDNGSDASSVPATAHKTNAKNCTTALTPTSTTIFITKPNKSTPATPFYMIKIKGDRYNYMSMVHEAITALKDRTGSSLPAIIKCMKSKHCHLNTNSQNMLNKTVLKNLKSGAKEKRFIKIKSSYKINVVWMKEKKAALRAIEVTKKLTEKKRKLEGIKLAKKKKEEDKKNKKEEQMKKAKELALAQVEKKADKALLEGKKKAEKEEVERRKEEEATANKVKAAMIKEEALRIKAEEKVEAAIVKAKVLAKARALAERIRKRKFPMDDLKLIVEDKELNVKPPHGICSLPFLPFSLSQAYSENQPLTKKATPKSIINSCTNTLSSGSRGLISDVLQVYHFFRGDVGYGRTYDTTPEFTLKHLMYAVNEINLGNTKSSCVVPPLISHLFLAALRILTEPDDELDEDSISEGSEYEVIHPPDHIRMQSDLSKLRIALNESSWGEVVVYYMDMMERLYATDVSTESKSTVLRGVPIELEYDTVADGINEEGNTTDINLGATSYGVEESGLPDGFDGYLGPPGCTLSRAYTKLSAHDPWTLSAEELMALLRALVDDILAEKSDLANDIANREMDLFQLLKTRKAAESHYKKTRFAFEGPKRPSKSKVKKETNTFATKEGQVFPDLSPSKTALSESNDKSEFEKSNDIIAVSNENEEVNVEGDKQDSVKRNEIEKDNAKENETEKGKFIPTATKEQFERARKEWLKTGDDYERGLKLLISRTEPIGLDRNFNAFYFFHHDPDTIYVEVDKPNLENNLLVTESWHIIDRRSIFDSFVSSLDVRGIRESELFEELTGGYSTTSLKRFQFDDYKKKNRFITYQNKEKNLERRLKKAKIACAAEEAGGRRSGRLANVTASVAKAELTEVIADMKSAAETLKLESIVEPINYYSATGIELVTKFESTIEEGSTCWRLWNDKKKETLGIIGIIIEEILSFELICNRLASWERKDITRDSWRKKLKETAKGWENNTVLRLGPISNMLIDKSENNKENIGQGNSVISDATCQSTSNPISMKHALINLKEAIIDLEKRVFVFSGLEMVVKLEDEADDNISDPSQSGDDSSSDSESQEEDLHSDVTLPSLLCSEATALDGCMSVNNTNRVDWINFVKRSKTLSRLSALMYTFTKKAYPLLTEFEKGKATLEKAISFWKGETSRKRKGKSKNGLKKDNKYDSTADIWVNFEVTEQIISAKVKDLPWWPAHICIPKDACLSSTLSKIDRKLVLFVGERHVRIIYGPDEIKPLSDIDEIDLNEKYDSCTINNLKKSNIMTKRMMRGRGLYIKKGMDI